LEEKLRSKLTSMVPGKNELQKAFKFFDCDDGGYIDAAEFRKVFMQLNIPLEMDEAPTQYVHI
jgi:Ca2+-binding EF-hand superfamily protein